MAEDQNIRISEKQYNDSMNYLKEIANKGFFEKINTQLEEMSRKYISAKQNGEKQELKRIHNSARLIVESYSKDIFDINVKKVICYKEKIILGMVNNINIVSILNNDDEDYKIIGKAIENIYSISVTTTIASMILGCSRQYINVLYFKQNKIVSPIIGRTIALRLIDIL